MKEVPRDLDEAIQFTPFTSLIPTHRLIQIPSLSVRPEPMLTTRLNAQDLAEYTSFSDAISSHALDQEQCQILGAALQDAPSIKFVSRPNRERIDASMTPEMAETAYDLLQYHSPRFSMSEETEPSLIVDKVQGQQQPVTTDQQMRVSQIQSAMINAQADTSQSNARIHLIRIIQALASSDVMQLPNITQLHEMHSARQRFLATASPAELEELVQYIPVLERVRVVCSRHLAQMQPTTDEESGAYWFIAASSLMLADYRPEFVKANLDKSDLVQTALFTFASLEAILHACEGFSTSLIEVLESGNMHTVPDELYRGFDEIQARLAHIIRTAAIGEALYSQCEALALRLLLCTPRVTKKITLESTRNAVLGLQRSAMELVLAMGEAHPDRRLSLMNEALNWLDSPASTYEPLFGGFLFPVKSTVIAAYFVCLVNTTVGNVSTLFPPMANGKHATMPVVSKAAVRAKKNARQIAWHITHTLLTRGMKKNKDSPQRQNLVQLTIDMSRLALVPEAPGAELLLSALIQDVIMIIKDQIDTSAASLSVCISIMTLVGEHYFARLRSGHSSGSIVLDPGHNEDHLTQSCDAVTYTLAYLASVKDSVNHSSAYNLHAVLYCCLLTSSVRDEALAHTRQQFWEAAVAGFTEDNWGNVFELRDAIQYRRAIAEKEYRSVLMSRDSVQLYDRFVSFLTQMSGRGAIVVRTTAVRTLAVFLRSDRALFGLEHVALMLQNSIYDSSHQVREAALDIIGEYLGSHKLSTADDDYVKLIINRTGDTGLSVRKKALRIATSLYGPARLDVQVALFSAFLTRTRDSETTVRTLAIKAISHILFDPKSRTPKSPTPAVVLCGVWAKGELQQSQVSELYSKALNGLLEDCTLESVERATTEVVQTLVEDISDGQDIDVDSKSDDKLEQQLGLLSILTSRRSSLINETQLQRLVQVLMTDQTESRVYRRAMALFKNALKADALFSTRFLTDLQSLLQTRITRAPVREIAEAAPCFWRVCTLLGDESRVSSMAAGCLRRLTEYTARVVGGGSIQQPDKTLKKLMDLLGYLVRYSNLTGRHAADFKQLQSSKGDLPVSKLVISRMLPFVKPKSTACGPEVHQVALRAICNICLSSPALFTMAGVWSVFQWFMKGAAEGHRAEQAVIMECVLELLTAEEEFENTVADTERSNRKKKGVDQGKLSGEGIASKTLGMATTLSQEFMQEYVDIALSGTDEVAFLATRLLGKVVALGYVVPVKMVVNLIALESCPNEAFAQVARVAHRKLFDKHERSIKDGYIEGVACAATYRRALDTGTGPSYLEHGDLAFTYNLIKDKRPLRLEFISRLFKPCRFDLDQETTSDLAGKLVYASFVAANLIRCDLDNLEMVLSVAQTVDNEMSGVGQTLMQRIEEESHSDLLEIWEKLGTASLILCCLYALRLALMFKYDVDEAKLDDFSTSSRSADRAITASESYANSVLDFSVLCLSDNMTDIRLNKIRAQWLVKFASGQYLSEHLPFFQPSNVNNNVDITTPHKVRQSSVVVSPYGGPTNSPYNSPRPSPRKRLFNPETRESPGSGVSILHHGKRIAGPVSKSPKSSQSVQSIHSTSHDVEEYPVSNMSNPIIIDDDDDDD